MLNLETYQQLNNLSADTELLIGLSLDELQALAETSLSPKSQIELNKLLMKNVDNQLSNEESETVFENLCLALLDPRLFKKVGDLDIEVSNFHIIT